jgi:prolyl oligopeptidase
MLSVLRIFVVAVAAVAWPVMPPPLAPQPVVDHYPGGQTIVDPYRQLEDLKAPAVQAYFKTQATYTDDVLGRLGPGRDKLRADIGRLVDAGTIVSSLTRTKDDLFYLERPVGANDARLMVRAGNAAPRLLLDPDAFGKQSGSTAHLSISNLLPSPDGSHIAVGIVPGGAEHETHTRIVETATGTVLADDLPRTWFGATAWSPDGKTLLYNQLPDVAPGHEAERELNSTVFRHRIGDTGRDAPVFGIGVDPNVAFVSTDDPYILIENGTDYALGAIAHGVQNEQTIYVAPVAAVLAGNRIPWRKIADVDDDVTSFDVRGKIAYLLSHKDASRFKVTALDLSDRQATAATAATIVPEGTGVIQQIAVASDALYVRGIDGGPAQLRKLPWAGGTVGPSADVALPFPGTLDEFATDSRAPGAVLGLAGWTKPLLIYSLTADGTLADTGIRKAPAIDTSGYESLEVSVPSTEGAMVPVSIVMKRGTALDGSNPTYLEAYGSYGITIDPYFLGSRFAWLDAGGIWVVAHVRGGGEYGEDWHLAGKGPTKQHTIDDVVAAARYMIAQKYTSPAHLAIEGTSAGGITVGGAITQHPELFAAALDVVGVTDALRSETEPNGPGNVPEFGSSKTAGGFAQLDAMDAYVHIVDGRRYPAVLGITGINDPRVAPWQVAKFVARLRHASSSGRPVLMRVDYDAGHGMLAASRNQAVALLTDEFSFLMWQCGSPDFAGIPTTIGTTATASR